jgi:hypothetical protein
MEVWKSSKKYFLARGFT